MAFTGSQTCWTFLRELLEGKHDFRAAGHVFKMALYTSAASLDANTTAYTATNEVSGTGYTAGGMALTNVNPALVDLVNLPGRKRAVADFGDVVWAGATFTARGALIYNSSQAGNPAVQVLDFGFDRVLVSQTLTVTIPAATAEAALVRIGQE